MAIPANVQRQADEADRALDEAQAQVDQVAKPQAEPAPVQPQAEPVQLPEQRLTPAPPRPAVEEPVVESDEERQQREENETQRALDLERQRNETLQGKYNAEVPRLQKTVEELQGQIKELRQLSEAAQTPPHLKHLDPSESTELNEEDIDRNARIAQGVSEAGDAKLKQEMDSRFETVEARLEASRATIVWDTVEKSHPGAKEMNDTNPDWHAFLNLVDPISGMAYKELGSLAFSQSQPDRLVKIIDRFKEASGDPAPAPQVEQQLKPQTARTSVRRAAQTPRKELIKDSEVTRFFTDVSKGYYKGREEEASKIQDKYDKACLENRIIPG